MSRSRKKNPISKENSRGSNKKRKRIANKTVRAKDKIDDEGSNLNSGSEYKKFYEHWKISDYKFITTEEDALAYYREMSDKNSINYNPGLLKIYPTEKEYLRWWRRCYKNK